jgi:hypothetical protein
MKKFVAIAVLAVFLVVVPVATAGSFGVTYGGMTVDPHTSVASLPGVLSCDEAGAFVVADVAVQQGVMPHDPSEWRVADDEDASRHCDDAHMGFTLSFPGFKPGRAHFQSCVIEYFTGFNDLDYPYYAVDCSPPQWLTITAR